MDVPPRKSLVVRLPKVKVVLLSKSFGFLNTMVRSRLFLNSAMAPYFVEPRVVSRPVPGGGEGVTMVLGRMETLGYILWSSSMTMWYLGEMGMFWYAKFCPFEKNKILLVWLIGSLWFLGELPPFFRGESSPFFRGSADTETSVKAIFGASLS